MQGTIAIMKFLIRLLATAALALASTVSQAQMVRIYTNLGLIDWQLLPSAPITVANFLSYARAGDYTNAMWHRSAWYGENPANPFVIQGGGYRWNPPPSESITQVPTRGTIANEFSATRSNLRGTVAMAKVGNQPNSATSQWFINMSNQNTFLDTNNGGFTVFARVTAPGMATADRIAALPRCQTGVCNSPFDEMPLVNYQAGVPIRSQAVLISSVVELPANPTTTDRILNFIEASYPQYLGVSPGTATLEGLGYQYRYYTASNAYVGTKDGKVHYLLPAVSPDVQELGTVSDWLSWANAAGY